MCGIHTEEQLLGIDIDQKGGIIYVDYVWLLEGDSNSLQDIFDNLLG